MMIMGVTYEQPNIDQIVFLWFTIESFVNTYVYELNYKKYNEN